MLKIEAKTLEAFCGILSALVPECRLNITADGLLVRAVDTANVAMVQVLMPNTAFTEYAVEADIIGMDVTKWKGALNVMKPDSVVTLDVQKNSRILISGGGYDYKITPLDVNTVRKEANVPTFQLPNALEVDTKEFIEAIGGMAKIGDKARFTITGKTLTISAEGDTDFLKKEIEGELVADKKNEAAASSLFSLDYMRELSRGMKGAEKVTVHLGNDHPVRFDFTSTAELEAAYVVAPRIEQEA